MGAVYLIRHGQASFGSANYDQLSATGRQQARYCGQYLAEKGMTVHHWFSGTLERQKDTARLALEAMGQEDVSVTQDAGFNEFDHARVLATMLPLLPEEDPAVSAFNRAEGDRRKLFQPVFEKAVNAWLEKDLWDGLESWSEFKVRVNQALERVITSVGGGKNVAVVTSGGPVAAMLANVLNLHPQAALNLNWTIVNTSVTKLFFSGDRRSVGYFNNYSYLQKGADRSLITYR